MLILLEIGVRERYRDAHAYIMRGFSSAYLMMSGRLADGWAIHHKIFRWEAASGNIMRSIEASE
jgi:hypothetical protein